MPVCKMGVEPLSASLLKEVTCVIEVKNLVKQYGDHYAVDHLSFTVEDGQIFGFLGPNGAGKSTTMNIMTGYLAPTEGEVLIEGHNILEEPEEAKKCMGYLPEIPPLYPDMTVLEFLGFVAELKQIPKAERETQIGKVISLTWLEDMSNRLVRNLSKGYRQRLGLAQAVLGFPKVIILDEPTVGLDPKQMVEIREMIRSLAKEHTVIISSHILSEIREVCDHVLIIRKGRFVACDTPDHLEELLSAGNEISLQAHGSKENVEKILMEIPGVQRHALFPESDGTVRANLSADRDLREDLFRAFAKADCPLLELKPRMASLEDVFLDLTDDNDETAAKAAALLNGKPIFAVGAQKKAEREESDDESNL